MNYRQTLDFLYTQLPMFQRIGPKAFKKDLKNILKLVEFLDQPQGEFQSIHIAGTNGKGSVSHFLAAVFQATGYRTGLYTSPHYRDFRERIQVDGHMIGQSDVIGFVDRIKPALENIKPSFFEITVAMAFDYFRQCAVDVAIVETGLGGRLDSTNVLLPKLAVITNISLDHQGFLGDTLKEIAREKAGIIKPGIPVLIGERQEEVSGVFEEVAEKQKAPLRFAEAWVTHLKTVRDFNGLVLTFLDQKSVGKIELTTTLQSPFVTKNLTTVLGSIEMWNYYYPENHIDPSFIVQGIREMPEKYNYLGRWQILSQKPLILADSAHNQAGLETVLESLQEQYPTTFHFVLGFVFDKDWKKLLALFPKAGYYYFAKADIPRGLSADLLLEEAFCMGLNGRSFDSVREALNAAMKASQAEDVIFVGGSIFTVAEVV